MTTADFTADGLATLARFDATPAAPESWGARATDSTLHDELAAALDDTATGLWMAQHGPGWGRVVANVLLSIVDRHIADHLGQQLAAIDRLKALADEYDARRGGELRFEVVGNAAARIRTALGVDL